MTDTYQFIIPVCVVILAVAAFFLWKYLEKKKYLNAKNKFIGQVLNEALKQKSPLDLKLLGSSANIGVSTLLSAINSSGLIMHTGQAVSAEWNKKPVEVYFRVMDEEEPVFYVFESKVLNLALHAQGSDITLLVPDHLRVEKKRHFERARPSSSDILMVAVWPISAGRRLPRTIADLGKPPVRWKAGDTEMPVRLENISGSGIALRFAESSETLPFEARKGRQIICLVAYKPETAAARPTVFWCTAEIMNTRIIEKSTAIGLEFTNWAVQEQGDTEIHWAHNSPWRGVKPILEWVKQLEMAHN